MRNEPGEGKDEIGLFPSPSIPLPTCEHKPSRKWRGGSPEPLSMMFVHGEGSVRNEPGEGKDQIGLFPSPSIPLPTCEHEPSRKWRGGRPEPPFTMHESDASDPW